MSDFEEKSIEENNERFWLQMTKQGTLRYCQEMLKLSIEFQNKKDPDFPYDQYLTSLDDEIWKYMDMVIAHTRQKTCNQIRSDESPFPTDLHAYIHEYTCDGKFQPNHLMSKLAALRDEENKLVYEFLIEYDIFETDVEIYFGVKAVSDSWKTTPQFQETVLSQWELVKEAGAYKRDLHRFKMTNNGNNGTFWPFWWRMGMDCKEELSDAVEIIRKFYTDYKKTLKLQDVRHPRFDIVKEEVENSMRRSEDYRDLKDTISKDFSKDACNLFETLIGHCETNEWIRRHKSADVLYVCLVKASKLVCLLKVFFYTMTWEFCNGKPSGFTPVKLLARVFLNKNGRAIGRKTWETTENNAPVAWDEAIYTLKAWFPNLNIKGERRQKK